MKADAKARIMVVEDESVVALNMRRHLEDKGYDASLFAMSGEQAVSLARDGSPDLILMDIRLPGHLDGIQAARIIDSIRSVPIVYLAESPDSESLERAKLTEPYGYLVKPFEINELVATIEMALYKHRMQARLHESESRLRKLSRAVEQSPSATVITDAEARIEYVNTSFEHLTGRCRQDLLGRRPGEFGAVRSSQGVFARMWNEVRSGRDFSGEIEVKNKDGSPLWVSVRASPIRDEQGRVCGYLGIFEDVSDRKFMDEELLAAMQAAEASNRAKGEFLSSMSHELRTPMNGILGMTDLCLETRLNDEQREYLTLVRQSAQSLLTVLNELLDYSKMESGQVALTISAFSLEELLAKVMPVFAEEARLKGLAFKWELAEGLPQTLYGDARRIGQIIGNLVGNAVKFTPTGSVEILARRATNADLPPADAQNSESRARIATDFDLLIEVRDTGIGIPLAMREQVFKRFVQVDGSRTRRFGGLGLGLTIAQSLAELMGGKLWFHNRVGEGSIFYFRVPLFSARPDGSEPEEERAFAVVPACLRILVADDNTINRLAVAHILSKQGHTVREVANGQEAVDLLQKEPFDLAILDLQMPVMDGLEAARAIRSMTGGASDSDLPVIALTARVTEDDRARCLNAGMSSYIGKPVSARDLVENVNRVMMSRTEFPMSASGKNLRIFDLDDVLKRFDNDLELLREVAAAFTEDAPRQIATIRRSLEEEDEEVLCRQAHTLKGAAGNIGAVALSAACRRLEMAAATNGAYGIEPLVESVELEYAKLKDLLISL